MKSECYAYDAAGRLVREGDRTYRYGYLDKVLSVTDGKRSYRYAYHVDGQLARADYGEDGRAGGGEDGRAGSPLPAGSEAFLWDGLALVRRGDESFVNEPHVGDAPKKLRFGGKPRAKRSARRARKGPRGNPVVSSKGAAYFNDALGTTVGVREGRGASRKGAKRRYTAAALTAFGEPVPVAATSHNSNIRQFDHSIISSPFFTGKPEVEGLGRVFLYRNYRADLAKWQTADPLGYPDGWNQLAYCENRVTKCIDFLGGSCGYEYIWHEYKDCTFDTRPGTAYESLTPPQPMTRYEDVIKAIESLDGLTVTHRTQPHIYRNLWDQRDSSKEWKDGDYTYKEEYFQQHQFVSIRSYVTFSKNNFLDVLGDIATGVGGAIEIVRLLFPSLRIPSYIASGTTLTGFVSWVGENLTGDTQRVDIMVRYKECWTDRWMTEYWHILE